MTIRPRSHRLPAASQCALVSALMGLPVAANAATATTTFSVTATVLATCAVSATPVVLGNYSGSQLDGTGTISVLCTNATTYTVALDAGVGVGATVSVRKMTGPSSQTLNYSLYHDAGRSSVWGSTVGTDTSAGAGSGLAQSITVYGRIPATQAPNAGAYSDTVTVTVAY